jgi:hypothetical protein
MAGEVSDRFSFFMPGEVLQKTGQPIGGCHQFRDLPQLVGDP